MKNSKLGLGCWGLGGDAYGPISFKRASEVVVTAIETGYTYFDTAPTYGQGKSELVIGEQDINTKTNLRIGTKFGVLPHIGQIMPHCFDELVLKQSLFASRSRLAAERLDCVYLHSPPLDLRETDISAVRKVISDEIAEGRVKYFGISLKSPNDYKVMAEIFPEATWFQFNYNLIDQRFGDLGYFEKAAMLNHKLVCRTPFVFGFLAGATHQTVFTSRDHRNTWSKKQCENWSQSVLLFEQLARSEGLTTKQLALMFCMSNSFISYVIPGAMSPSEVIENWEISQLGALSSQCISKIRAIYEAYDFTPIKGE